MSYSPAVGGPVKGNPEIGLLVQARVLPTPKLASRPDVAYDIVMRQVARHSALVSPVYVIGGFLGSGKTTLLKRLLAHEIARGVRPGVLMNELGGTDVDGPLVHDHGGDDVELRSLLSSCVVSSPERANVARRKGRKSAPSRRRRT